MVWWQEAQEAIWARWGGRDWLAAPATASDWQYLGEVQQRWPIPFLIPHGTGRLWLYADVLYRDPDDLDVAVVERILRERVQRKHLTIARAQALEDEASRPSRHIPRLVREQVYLRDEGRCVRCGATEELTYDHVLPVSRGGTGLTSANVELMCFGCNRLKSNRLAG